MLRVQQVAICVDNIFSLVDAALHTLPFSVLISACGACVGNIAWRKRTLHPNCINQQLREMRGGQSLIAQRREFFLKGPLQSR